VEWSYAMDTLELRIALTEELVRELLWHALVPEALVKTGALNKALEKQQDMQSVSLNGYTLNRISVAIQAGTMYAELAYRQQARSRQTDSAGVSSENTFLASEPPSWTGSTRPKDKVRTASEDSFPASDPPSWTGSEAGSTEREVGT
jgi:hypothetical protein